MTKKKVSKKAKDNGVLASVSGWFFHKWIYKVFSTHHGMEAPEYKCKYCGKEIKTDDEKLPKEKCSGKK